MAVLAICSSVDFRAVMVKNTRNAIAQGGNSVILWNRLVILYYLNRDKDA